MRTIMPLSCRLLALAVAGCLIPAATAQRAEEIRATVGRSLVLDYPTGIGRISTSSPEVVDAMAVTSREILLHAKGLGNATVIVWSKSGQRTFYNISVDQNLEPIRGLLKATFPNEDIHVEAARDSVSLIGNVTTQQVADKAAALAAPLARTVVNNLRATPPGIDKQIVLHVKFAEVGRNASFSYGTNVVSTGALNTPFRTATGQFTAPSPGTLNGGGTVSLSDALNIFAFRSDLKLGAVVELLQGQGLLQILAEPNLVTSNGKEASFLVGGEFPVPVLQGGGSNGAVTVQFREYGIRLTFLPTITDNKTIKLYVKPEVSTIDMSAGVVFNGFTIPALATRRMETNIELGEGQSFAIAGLIDDRVSDSIAKIPGLANIPILGALFKSKKETKSKSELLVVVTPEITSAATTIQSGVKPVMPRTFLAPLPPAKQFGAAAKPASGGQKKR
jgi:pilus assembly protein CpaC